MPGIDRFSKRENTQDAEGQRKKNSTRGYSNVIKDAWTRKDLEVIGMNARLTAVEVKLRKSGQHESGEKDGSTP